MTTTAAPQNLSDFSLDWSPALSVGDARMDETHQEFTELLNQILATPVDRQLLLYRQFIAHTEAHFAQEERWMQATGFPGDHCHAGQHATILETMNAVAVHFEGDDKDIITRMAEALTEWFPQHTGSMDAGLAQYLKEVGFDTRTETLADPSKLQMATISGCGSVS